MFTATLNYYHDTRINCLRSYQYGDEYLYIYLLLVRMVQDDHVECRLLIDKDTPHTKESLFKILPYSERIKTEAFELMDALGLLEYVNGIYFVNTNGIFEYDDDPEKEKAVAEYILQQLRAM